MRRKLAAVTPFPINASDAEQACSRELHSTAKCSNPNNTIYRELVNFLLLLTKRFFFLFEHTTNFRNDLSNPSPTRPSHDAP